MNIGQKICNAKHAFYRDPLGFPRYVFRKLFCRTPKAVVAPESLAFFRSEKTGAPRLLFLLWASEKSPATIMEYPLAFQKYSSFAVDILNVNGINEANLARTPIALSEYKIIFFHSGVTYSWNYAEFVNSLLISHIFKNIVKIYMRQDEARNVNDVCRSLIDLNIHILVSCVPVKELEKVYPPKKLGNVIIFRALTGYVTDALRRMQSNTLAERPVDVSYRGSLQPYVFGKLCYEKRWISGAFTEAASRHPLGSKLKLDISNRWEDRVYGEAWIDLLRNSRAVLGTESGMNLFDFDGSLEKACAEYEKEHPECTFEEVWELFLKNYEGNVNYAQISPRHFEAAACRCVQILFEGDYSGIFLPDRHYIALKKDFSNFDDVMEKLADNAFCERMVECAYAEIIMNDAWHYKNYVNNLDAVIQECLTTRE